MNNCPGRLLALLLLCAAPLAQGSLADYERMSTLGERTQGLIVNGNLDPHWVEGEARLWYGRTGIDGKREYVLLDCESGGVTPLFDEARVAEALDAHAKGTPLSIALVALKGGLVHLLLEEGLTVCEFDCATQEVRIVPLAETDAFRLPPCQRLPRSRAGVDDTEMVFANGLDAPLALFWIDEGGVRHPYGHVAPGDVKRQHTFARHAWILVDETGADRGAFIAQRELRLAWVGPDTPRPMPPREGEEAIRSDRSAPPEAPLVIRNADVFFRDMETGLEVALTSDGTEEHGFHGPIFFSPDRKRAVVMKTRAGDSRTVHYVESAPPDRLQPRLHAYDYLKPGDRVPISKPHLFDLEARREIPISDELFANPYFLGQVRWVPDSSRFTFFYNQRGHQVVRVIVVDAETGIADALVDETTETFVDYSQKSTLHFLDATDELIWASERDGWNHLYLYDTKTGRVKNPITTGEWVVRGIDHVDEEKRWIRFRAMGIDRNQDPYHVHHCRIDFDGGNLVRLTEGDGTHTIELSPDGTFLVDTWSRADLAPVVEVRRTADGAFVHELGRADMSKLRDTGWRPPQRFVAKGRDGETDIWGLIRRPSNYDPHRRYPVIEYIYAGPHGQHVPKSFRRVCTQDEIAELGFIVVQIDGMGTNWRSRAFHDVCWENLGDAGFPDRMLWIQAAARDDPSMDLSRVGIYGGSAGGQNALRALLAHPGFYHVAAADCGCHDNRMDKIWWNEAWMGWPIGPHYEEQSNVTQAHRLEGKLLLFVGAMDENVDPASTMQVVDALIRADKDFDLVVTPSAGHGSAESAYGKRRRRDFFVRHLLGVEPRWEAK
jgi:dipeptidyl-peptidase 4